MCNCFHFQRNSIETTNCSSIGKLSGITHKVIFLIKSDEINAALFSHKKVFLQKWSFCPFFDQKTWHLWLLGSKFHTINYKKQSLICLYIWARKNHQTLFHIWVCWLTKLHQLVKSLFHCNFFILFLSIAICSVITLTSTTSTFFSES